MEPVVAGDHSDGRNGADCGYEPFVCDWAKRRMDARKQMVCFDYKLRPGRGIGTGHAARAGPRQMDTQHWRSYADGDLRSADYNSVCQSCAACCRFLSSACDCDAVGFAF